MADHGVRLNSGKDDGIESGTKAKFKSSRIPKEGKGTLFNLTTKPPCVEKDLNSSINSGEASKVSRSNESKNSCHQILKAVTDSQISHKMHNQRNHKQERINTQQINEICGNVAPSGDGIGNKDQSPVYNDEVQKHSNYNETVLSSVPIKPDPPNTNKSATNTNDSSENQGDLSLTQPENSNLLNETKNSNLIKKYVAHFRPRPHFLPKVDRVSAATEEGTSNQSADHQLEQTSDQHPHKQAEGTTPNPKTKRKKINKSGERMLPTSGGECKGVCMDISKEISMSPLQNNSECKNEASTYLEKSEQDSVVVAQICQKLETSTCEMSTAPIEHRRTVSDVKYSNLDGKDNASSLTPIDEVDTLTTITDVSVTCEGDRKPVPKQLIPAFKSQNFVHFSTAVTPSIRREVIQVTTGVLHKFVTPQLKPYKRTSRRIPITNSSRITSREKAQVAPNFREVLSNSAQSFNRKLAVRRRFFLPESANLEDILADSGDRRIIAICNKFNCEMVAFSKVPRKGSLRHEVILLASCKEDIARCARCLDARLNWCISPQLD